MNPLNISSRIRQAALRTALRAAGYLLQRAIAPALASALKTAPAAPQAHDAGSRPESGQVIDGEFRRVDRAGSNRG